MPVSVASIILVFPPRVIVITLFRKKLSTYYIILNSILLSLRLQSSASCATLSKAPATSSNIRLAIAFLLIPYTVQTASIINASADSTNLPCLAPIYSFGRRLLALVQSRSLTAITASNAFPKISKSTIGRYTLGFIQSGFFGFFKIIVLASLNLLRQYPSVKHAQNRYLIYSLNVAFITLRNLFGTLFSLGALFYTGFYIALRISKSVSSFKSSISIGYFTRPVSILARRGGGKRSCGGNSISLRRSLLLPRRSSLVTGTLVVLLFSFILLFFPYAAML